MIGNEAAIRKAYSVTALVRRSARARAAILSQSTAAAGLKLTPVMISGVVISASDRKGTRDHQPLVVACKSACERISGHSFTCHPGAGRAHRPTAPSQGSFRRDLQLLEKLRAAEA